MSVSRVEGRRFWITAQPVFADLSGKLKYYQPDCAHRLAVEQTGRPGGHVSHGIQALRDQLGRNAGVMGLGFRNVRYLPLGSNGAANVDGTVDDLIGIGYYFDKRVQYIIDILRQGGPATGKLRDYFGHPIDDVAVIIHEGGKVGFLEFKSAVFTGILAGVHRIGHYPVLGLQFLYFGHAGKSLVTVVGSGGEVFENGGVNLGG